MISLPEDLLRWALSGRGRSTRLRLKRQHRWRMFAVHGPILLVVFIGCAIEFLHAPFDLSYVGSLLRLVKDCIRYGFIFLVRSFFSSVPLLIALIAISRLASRFVRDLYDTEDLEEAQGVAHRSMFGMPGDALKPLLIVEEGHITLGAGTTCDRIGGPGFVVVHGDSAAVLERGGRLSRVLGPAFCFLERYERVWEVIDLRQQHWPLAVTAMTKEGIPVSCQADITFKIDDRDAGQQGEVPARSLAHTDEAVFNAATSTWVRIHEPDHPEQTRKWTGRVMIGEVEGILRMVLADYRLDWLMQPPWPGRGNPREEIRERLEKRLREKLSVGNDKGARILNVDLGEIDVKDEKIYAQWVEAWQADWRRRAVEDQAEGEAEIARLDAARVQAQAEMVLTLIETIRPLVSSEEELHPYLMAMRFTETLRWMAYDPHKRMFLPPETLRMLSQLEQLLANTHSLVGDGLPGTDDAGSELGRLLPEIRGA